MQDNFNFNSHALADLRKDSQKAGQALAEKNENGELVTLYNAMQLNPEKEFNCHDVADILENGTNIASRLFEKLLICGYIMQTGRKENDKTHIQITHYKIINKDENLDFVKIKNTIKEYTVIEKASSIFKKLDIALMQKDFTTDERKFLAAIAMQVKTNIKEKNQNENIYNFFTKTNINYLDALKLLKHYAQK